MEPKLKAEELIRKFKPMVQFKMGVDPSYVLKMAIRCALVTVEEIIEACNNPEGTYYINNYYYWAEVKKQIEDYGKK